MVKPENQGTGISGLTPKITAAAELFTKKLGVFDIKNPQLIGGFNPFETY